MRKIFAILAVAFAALSLSSCNKTSTDTTDNQVDELIGSWRGTAVTGYTNGKPTDYATYTLTFTKSTITIDKDGKANSYPFEVGKNLDGTKYFEVTTASTKFSMLYSISGTTMTNLGGNSTDTYFWPKTFEKAVL